MNLEPIEFMGIMVLLTYLGAKYFRKTPGGEYMYNQHREMNKKEFKKNKLK